jgi:co-chaperonin GroES (HSP10)
MEAKRFIPLLDRVVVKVETRTQAVHQKFKALKGAGFEIPQTAEEKSIPDEGTVTSVGPTASLLKTGDRVLFGKWAAKALDSAPGHWVMLEDDVIGILAPDSDEAEEAIRSRFVEA